MVNGSVDIVLSQSSAFRVLANRSCCKTSHQVNQTLQIFSLVIGNLLVAEASNKVGIANEVAIYFLEVYLLVG